MKNEMTVNKYSPENLIRLAAASGSTAKTMRGAVRALITAKVSPSGLRGPGTGLLYIDWALGDLPGQHVRREEGLLKPSDYHLSETARHTNIEARRARDNAQFRRNFLRRLNTESARLMAPSVATVEDICAAVGSRQSRTERLAQISKELTIARGKKISAQVPEKIAAGILVKSFNADFAREMGAEINMSGLDARLIATRKASRREHRAGTTTWRNGNPVSYERATNNNYVRSFGVISEDKKSFDFIFVTTRALVTLPAEMHWDIDANGLHAVSGADDYHPRVEDLLAKNAAGKIAEILAANAETRKIAAAEGLAKTAEMMGVYVCAADSVAAGNCVAGTQSFASRHNFDVSKHYPATEILAHANGDTGRARLAIRCAINRTKKEVAQGFSVLADHKI